ncbi:MAG: Na+/H+ antiporter NhaC family protein, partial [Puniceicoccales bacterium]
MGLLRSIPLWVFIISTFLSWWAGQNSQTSWIVKATPLDEEAVQAQLVESGESSFLDSNQSNLWQRLNDSSTDIIQSDPGIYEQWVVDSSEADTASYYHLVVDAHNGFWSVFPALVTIILCFLTREPITSLLAGIISGALILGNYDVMHEVLIPGIASPSAALIIVLYLGFLGSLLGIWSRNGAAQAFADWITHRFVRGPKTAKLSAWLLGIFFFQGGTISTLLVGTTVKPVADKEKISHEELSFIVDATASPIAVLLPFNAWPFYIQGLLYVGGVTALATEELRLAFFFASIPLFFYAILAVLFTFLMSIDRLPFMGKSLKAAIKRSRETGELDRPGSTPLQQSDSISRPNISEGYRPAAFEFFLPLVIIIGIAVGTYLLWDSPNVLWAFAIALIVAALTSRIRGISLKSLIEGVSSGLQGVVYGAVILLLAVVIGG